MKRLQVLSVFSDDGFQSQAMIRWQPLYARLFDSRWTLIFLLALGIVRVIFFLNAYAPADGADALDYYGYAAYMNGIDLPSRVANVSPIYPFFIYLNHYVLGNFNLIIVWQMVMSATLGLLYYVGLRRYNALLAFLVALMVIGDAQTGVSFNLVSTEPLYLFLLACIYALTLIQHQTSAANALQVRDILIGILLVIVRETRTVARYIVVPVWILYALATRNWKRALVVLLSFLLTGLFFRTSTVMTQTAQVESTNDTMLYRPLIIQKLLDAEAGASSAELQTAIDRCKQDTSQRRLHCLEGYFGGATELEVILNQAYIESVVQHPFSIYRRMFEGFTAFLQLSGRQVYGNPTPADVQCEDIPERIERNIEQIEVSQWANIDVTDAQRAAYREVMTDFTNQMCPPAPTNATIQAITDTISFRYRSLSRTNPYLWYGTLIALVLLIPWARKLWLPVFLAGGLLAYHAAISAAVFNVQPRYAMVTNPFKGLLLIALLVILAYSALKILDSRLQ